MVVGLIGCGNMGSALARGWRIPVRCSDAVPGLAEALAAETGGEALADNATVAERCDVLVLAHKPHQLEEVAAQVGGKAKAVASILAGVPIAALETAYPETPVMRLMPNTAVAVGRGVICYAPNALVDERLETETLAILSRSAKVVRVDEKLMDVAMGLMSVAPAYVALVAEAWIDAGVARGMPAPQAAQLVAEAIAGSADLLIAEDVDTLKVRRAVTTPGGVTAQGLAALEDAGVRAAFRDALDRVLGHLG